MKHFQTHRSFLACLSIIAVTTILVSCGGGGDTTLSASGGSVQIRLSASGGSALLSAIPADAVAARSTTGGITVMDGPSDSDRPHLQSVEVTFSSIEARTAAGTLVPVTAALPVTVDLLALSAGRTVDLPVGYLPADTYQGFVVTVSRVLLLLTNGTRITVEPPGEGWATEIATQPFTVVDGQPTTVELNLRADLALRWMGDHFEFEPVFDDCRVRGGGDDDRSDDHDGEHNGSAGDDSPMDGHGSNH